MTHTRTKTQTHTIRDDNTTQTSHETHAMFPNLKRTPNLEEAMAQSTSSQAKFNLEDGRAQLANSHIQMATSHTQIMNGAREKRKQKKNKKWNKRLVGLGRGEVG